MLAVFLNIGGMILMNWLSQGASFNGAYFNEKNLQPMAAEIQREERAKHCPWTLVHMDNAKPYMSKWNLAIMEELHLKRTAYPPARHEIAPSNFFLFG
jgi:hypothetical protein